MISVRRGAFLGAMRLRAAAPAKSKGGKKAAAAAEASGNETSLESREKVVLGANILKEGSDPAVKEDSDYPDWLWSLLDQKPALSDLKRKPLQDMSMDELERLVKLDNRTKISQRNAQKAKA